MGKKGKVGGLVGIVLMSSAIASASAGAATISTNTLADEDGGGSACSLREAIQAANTDAGFGGCPAGSGADVIQLAAGTYGLTKAPDGSNDDNVDGDLDIANGSVVTISHSGLDPTAISAAGIADRVLNVLNGGTATVSGLTIRDGRTAGAGGGIRNDGTLELSSVTVTNNESTGSFGGGISNVGTMTLTNVTVSGNRAESDSGGIDQDSGGPEPLNLNHVTVTSNIADSDGNNSGTGGGIYRASGPVNLRNTIIAGNSDNSPGEKAPDCDSLSTPSQGNNLIGDATNCDFTPAGGDKVNVNPLLGGLADNGGSTFTHALLAGSPAIDGAAPGAVAIDQRGVPRSSDIGAYERVTCGAVVINRVGTSGADALSGTAGADGFLLLAGNDSASGLGGGDAMCGGDNKDKLKGGPGKDLLRGEGGKDTLKGGGGKDKLVGGPGRDLLVGGKGKDRCKGGGGRDTQRAC